MSVFDGIVEEQNVEKEQDRVRGSRKTPADSDIYNLVIKHVYVKKAKSGATGVHALFKIADQDKEIRVVEYISSGDAKGRKTYYEKKQDDGTMKKFNLPGFTAINDLCILVTGQGVLQQNSEKRTIALYDFDKKADAPTEVDMLVDLVNKGVCGAVLHQIQDKTKKDPASGEYEPTGQTFSTNVIDKFLSANNRSTVIEQTEKLSPDFQKSWLNKWKGKIDDQSTEVPGAGMKGAPQASGANAEKTELFK